MLALLKGIAFPLEMQLDAALLVTGSPSQSSGFQGQVFSCRQLLPAWGVARRTLTPFIPQPLTPRESPLFGFVGFLDDQALQTVLYCIFVLFWSRQLLS